MPARATDPIEPPPKRRRIPRWLPQALGWAASAASIAWVLHGYSIRRDLIPAIQELDWGWAAIAVAAQFGVFFCQAWRWNTLLAPVVQASYWPTAKAIYIGQFANQVLPLRTGELIRCYLLAHWNDLRVSLALASAAVERLIDGFWMLAAFLATAAFIRNMPRDVLIGVQALAVLLFIGAVLMGWVVFHRQHAHAVLRERKWAATLRHVIEGVHLMGNPRTMAYTALISGIYLAIQVLSVWALMKADLMDLSFWQAGGVLAVVRLAIVVPSGPGNLGLLQVASVLALGLFDVEQTVAKTFSNLLFAVETIPPVVGGPISLLLTGVNLRELRERARHSMHTHAHQHPPEQS